MDLAVAVADFLYDFCNLTLCVINPYLKNVTKSPTVGGTRFVLLAL